MPSLRHIPQTDFSALSTHKGAIGTRLHMEPTLPIRISLGLARTIKMFIRVGLTEYKRNIRMNALTHVRSLVLRRQHAFCLVVTYLKTLTCIIVFMSCSVCSIAECSRLNDYVKCILDMFLEVHVDTIVATATYSKGIPSSS